MPTVSVQVQRDFKLAYQRSMNSWRLGLSNGVVPSLEGEPSSSVPLTSRLAAFLIPSRQQFPPLTRENRTRYPPQDLQHHSFCVREPSCQHDDFPPAHNPRRYDRATLWSWQTESSLRLWTPEIYSSVRCPVTVMREVPVAEIDALQEGPVGIAPYLEFDFSVDVQLRVLGVGFGSWLTGLFKSGSRPAEMRLQSDTGQPLPTDRVRFSISCHDISWPLYPTRNLQEEAEGDLVLRSSQIPVPQRLPTNAEFYQALQQQSKENLVAFMSETSCRCQTLGPQQNRLYHCRMDCTAGHAVHPVRRAHINERPSLQPVSVPASLVNQSQSFSIKSSVRSPTMTPPARWSSAQTAASRPQFRRRTSLEKILLQERKRKSLVRQ